MSTLARRGLLSTPTRWVLHNDTDREVGFSAFDVRKKRNILIGGKVECRVAWVNIGNGAADVNYWAVSRINAVAERNQLCKLSLDQRWIECGHCWRYQLVCHSPIWYPQWYCNLEVRDLGRKCLNLGSLTPCSRPRVPGQPDAKI